MVSDPIYRARRSSIGSPGDWTTMGVAIRKSPPSFQQRLHPSCSLRGLPWRLAEVIKKAALIGAVG